MGRDDIPCGVRGPHSANSTFDRQFDFEGEMSPHLLAKLFVAPALNVVRVRPYSGAAAQLPILTLYTKDPCPLCEEAKESLSPLSHRFSLREIDITDDGNEDLYDKYKFEIPVFFLEKKFLCKNRIEVEMLEQRLREFEGSS